MERPVLVKFIFAGVIGLVLLSIILSNLFGGDEKETPEEIFDSGASTSDMDFDDSLLDDNSDEDANEELVPEDSELDEKIEIESGIDYNEVNTEELGAVEYDNAHGLAERFIERWIEKPFEIQAYEEFIDKGVMEGLIQGLETMDTVTSRSLTSLSVYSVEPNADDEVRFGALASWHVVSNGEPINQQTQLFYVSVAEKGDSWKVVSFEDLSQEENHFHN